MVTFFCVVKTFQSSGRDFDDLFNRYWSLRAPFVLGVRLFIVIVVEETTTQNKIILFVIRTQLVTLLHPPFMMYVLVDDFPPVVFLVVQAKVIVVFLWEKNTDDALHTVRRNGRDSRSCSGGLINRTKLFFSETFKNTLLGIYCSEYPPVRTLYCAS